MARTGMTQAEAGRLGGEATKSRYLIRKDIKTAEYEKNPKPCLSCASPIPYTARNVNLFCSQSCSIGLRNHFFPTRGGYPPIPKCVICRQVTCRINDVCSSCSCLIRIQRGEVLYRPPLKSYLYNLRGYACEVCKNTKWNKLPIPLELDHINGDASNCHESNIRLLCPNCHAQTPTAKGKNKGNGRGSRGMKRF